MASEVEICNIALQKLGADRINLLTEDSVNARECNLAYAVIRDRELRKHSWTFAKKTVALAASTTKPLGYARQFPLPSDWLRTVKILADPEDKHEMQDFALEGRNILSDETVVYLKYIRRVEDPNEFDTLFIDVLASALAYQLCEKLTQSNTKKDEAKEAYKDAISEAKRINAIERPPDELPPDDWITVRQ